LAAFCSSPLSFSRLDGKVAASRKAMGSERQLLLPDAEKVWQGTELFISGDQRPATVKRRGRDEAISRIAMLKQGAAGENSDLSRDGLSRVNPLGRFATTKLAGEGI
jgi:hypothetical protein